MQLDKMPYLKVGILRATEIRFKLYGAYLYNKEVYIDVCGKAIAKEGKVQIIFENNTFSCSENCYFQAQNEEAFCEIEDVVIGVGFHWERKETQRFRGDLKIIASADKCVAINILPLEEYLESVISSEMNAKASKALLKTHAVISRSWLLAQVLKKEEKATNYQSVFETEEELVRWYDREEHQEFDVCADDHCQRYQGITRIGAKNVIEAVRETNGEVLMYANEICDARYSKCCGGVVESFENVWEEVQKPYLVPLRDAENESLVGINLREDRQANDFIKSTPNAYCNTKDSSILATILNDYDRETEDFYRWKVRYSQKEFSDLVKKRTGIDYGLIRELVPIERSYSGRLKRLKIVGEKCTRIIGKELEIRKTLSESHLYSSAFVVERAGTDFVLEGAGWGHGVGLCQIGAAVMGAKGADYTTILYHYFKNVELKKIY
ncbi:MAG: SpoIID/LytB domain-containing protein [Flavobacteriaceae bacterium]|nr:SpoIID/LytB domain-containing protein [Flavobacteriaceae bacterium]